MQSITKIVTGVVLLAAVPAAMTAVQLGVQTPHHMASTVLASLGTSTPDHTLHNAGCGCAACQQGCQVIDPSTV